jgi:hypothetical protein
MEKARLKTIRRHEDRKFDETQVPKWVRLVNEFLKREKPKKEGEAKLHNFLE